MKNKIKSKQGGFFKIIILIIIALLVMSYFKINIKSIITSPTGQENVNYVGGGIKSVWTTYLAEPAHYLWNDVWLNIFWRPFISNMKRILNKEPTDFDKAGDNLKVP